MSVSIEMCPDYRASRDTESERVTGVASLSQRNETRSLSIARGSRPSADSLQDQLELSVIEIAVMWILHQQTLSSPPERPLHSDIANFYPVAFNTISRALGLRGAKQRDLRLVYFKGIIVAHTHPKQQMVDAIKHADRLLDHATASGIEIVVHSPRPDPTSGDQAALAHIADALSGPSGPAH